MNRRIGELMDLTGKTALITGGAGHLGKVMAEALAECGANVILTDRDPDTTENAAREVAAGCNARVLAVAASLEDMNAPAVLENFIREKTGRLDILINNAAFVGTSNLTGWNVPFEEQSADSWNRAVDINLNAVFRVTRQLESLLRASPGASIVNIGSIYGICAPDFRLYEGLPMNNPAAYGAAKAGLIQFTRYCATCFAPDIRVNAITPGGIFRNQDPRFVERYESRTPMKRMAREEDFKGTILYLVSDLSAYVTGQNLVVDGGFSCW